jgi:hypothetical protein
VSRRIPGSDPSDNAISFQLWGSFDWDSISNNGGDPNVALLETRFYTNANFQAVSPSGDTSSAADDIGGMLARPQWSYDPSSGNLGYYGTLNRLTDLGDQSGIIDFWIDDAAQIQIPLTFSYYSMNFYDMINEADDTPDGGEFGSFLEWIQTRLTDPDHEFLGQTTFANLQQNDSDNIYLNAYVSPPTGDWNDVMGGLASDAVSNLIHLHGYGKIVGWVVRNRAMNTWDDADINAGVLSNPCTLAEVLDLIEYQILSELIGLASTAPGSDDTASIDVWGIGVADMPKRNSSSMQINGYNVDYDADYFQQSNVKIFDLKAVGGWIDASDGPEILVPNSRMDQVFIHTQDDSIKIAADNYQAYGITVWQGNAGGVVNVGNYGVFADEITYANIDGVYVHRITQANDQSWDGRGGMITSRMGAWAPDVHNVWLKNFFVPSLGGDLQYDASGGSQGLKGPNVIYRAFAIGLLPTAEAYHGWTNDYTSLYNWNIIESEIFVNPLAVSLIYAGGDYFNADVYKQRFGNKPCGYIGDINFYDPSASTVDEVNFSAFKIYPEGDFSWYYAIWPNGDENADFDTCNGGLEGWAIADDGSWIGLPSGVYTMDWPDWKPTTEDGREVADWGAYPAVGGDDGNLINVPFLCPQRRALVV